MTPKGVASYFIEYRMPDKRRLTIGSHGRLTPAEARKHAKVLLGDVAKGIDVARQPQGRTPPSGFSKAKARLDSLTPDIPHWRFHDLRRNCASGMAAMGFLPNVIERVLNHQSGSNAGLVNVYQMNTGQSEEKRS